MSHTERKTYGCLAVMAGGITIVFFLMVIDALQAQCVTLGYARVTGTIETSEVVYMPAAYRRPAHWEPRVTYSYVVGGVTYRGTRYSIHPVAVDEDWQPDIISPPGSSPRAVVVHYSPDQPSDAVLHPSSLTQMLKTTAGVSFTAAMTTFFAFMWHRQRRGT